MPLPGNVTTATVAARQFLDGTGAPLTGKILLVPSTPILNPGGAVILAAPITLTLDGTGAIPATAILATNSANINPTGFTYQAIFQVNEAGWQPFSFAAASGTTIDLATVAPVGSSSGQPVFGPTVLTAADSTVVVAGTAPAPTVKANVGTAAGTVAAGNDSRITGAAQKASNLSDLASAATARTNLGLAAVAASGSATDITTGTLAAARVGDLSATYARYYMPEAYGAVGDGVADDTTAVQAALTACPNGSQVRLSKTYLITSQLNFSGKSGAVIAGGGKIHFASTAAATHGEVYALQVVNGTDVRVEGLEIIVDTQGQAYNGIQVTTSTNVVVKNCTVRNARWAGIAAYDSGAPASQNITIEDCYVERCRFGISGNAKWMKILNNTIGCYWLSSSEAGSPWQSSSNHYDGIILTTSPAEYEVSGNLIIEPGQSGIYTSDCTKGTVTGNTILRPQNWGIDFGPTTAATYLTVTGNTIIDAAQGGINFFKVNYSTISGNTVINTGTLYFGAIIDKAGIALNSSSSFNTIVGNTVLLPVGATSAGIFANATGSKTLSNVFSSNNVQAPTPRSINTTDNTLLDLSTLTPTSAVGAHMVSGNYYTTPGVTPSASIPAEATVRAIPLYIGVSGTINQLAASITVAGSAGAVLRLGVYADDGSGSYPGALLVDGGTVAATGTGVVTVAVSVPVTSGTLIWLALAVQGGAGTRPTIRTIITNSVPFDLGDTSSNILDNQFNSAQINTGVAGALPSSATWFHSTTGYRVALKAA